MDLYFTKNRLRVSVFILLVELSERFTFYTIFGSLKAFLQDRDYSQSQSSSLSLVFATTCYLWTIAGSICGDRYYRRYTVIATCLTIYIIGGVLVTIAALPTVRSDGMFLIGAMVFVACGTGGMKPNICNFGAEQIPAHQRASFLSWFYWFINIRRDGGIWVHDNSGE